MYIKKNIIMYVQSQTDTQRQTDAAGISDTMNIIMGKSPGTIMKRIWIKY